MSMATACRPCFQFWRRESLPSQLNFWFSARSLPLRVREYPLTQYGALKPASIRQHTSNSLPFARSSKSSKSHKDRPGSLRNTIHPIPSAAAWLLMILYRALLVCSIGFSFATPAIANSSPPAVAPSHKTVEKSTKKAMEEDPSTKTMLMEESSKKKMEEEPSTNSSEYLHPHAELWSSIDTSGRSIEDAVKDFLDANPTNVQALEFLVYSLLEKENMAHALKVLEKLEQVDPQGMEWKYMKAEVYDANGQLELSRKAFEDILKLDPSSLRALQGLLIVMDELGDAKAALDVVEACVARARHDNNHEESRKLRMLIGQFHSLKGRLEQALKVYTDLITEDPSDFRPFLCQGIIYSAMGESNKAEQQFSMYRKLCPRNLPDKMFMDELMSRARRGENLFDLENREGGED